MANKFWLIQRGSFNRDLTQATSFLNGRGNALINPDYMGAAEFEWGAIPKAYRRIMGQFEKYSLHITDLKTTGGVPFCVYCNDEYYEEVLEAIKIYLDKQYQLKEWTNMTAHFNELPADASDLTKDHRKYELRTNFWWCIDINRDSRHVPHHIGDWIAFTGAADRQRKFMEVLTDDWKNWWLKKSEEDQKNEFESACRSW